MPKSFSEFVALREESEGGNLTSKIKLQKSKTKEFEPFVISKTIHPNLRFLVKAFLESGKIGLGYTTIDKSKGEHEPQLKRKSLWLTGGAVRDHLKNKTPKNYDLVTDATASEIRKILTQNESGFTETKPRSEQKGDDKKYMGMPSPGSKNKIFYVSRWDKQGKELEITVEINGEKFQLATLGKHSKSRMVEPNESEAVGSLEDDAKNRDFTMNAMYIPLTTADGENSDLIDPHGGAHHLKKGQIVPIGDFGERMDEDPSVALKMTKLLHRYGSGDKIPDELKKIISKRDLSKVPKDQIRSEFIDGLESPETDIKKFLKLFRGAGLLDSIIPGSGSEDDLPPNMPNDRWMATAWLSKDSDPEELKKNLGDSGWSRQESGDIAHLVSLHNWAKNGMMPDNFYDLKHAPHGLSKNKLRDWMKLSNVHPNHAKAFLDHDDSDLSPYTQGEDGRRSVNSAYVAHLGRMPQGSEFDQIRRFLATKRWHDSVNQPK